MSDLEAAEAAPVDPETQAQASADPGAAPLPQGGGETAQADPTQTNEGLMEQLRALRNENARLAGELSARYDRAGYGSPEAARGLEPQQPAASDPIKEIAEQLGVEPDRLAKAFEHTEAAVAARVSRDVEARIHAQRQAEQVASNFFARYPKLADHKATVDQIVRSFAADPLRLRGREWFREDVLAEIAQETHKALQIDFHDAQASQVKGPVIVQAGNVAQAQVAPGRSGGGGAGSRQVIESEPDGVTDWIDGIKSVRERGISGAHGRLAGVSTK